MSANTRGAPLGIKVICILGFLGVGLGLLMGLGLMAYGGLGVLLGMFVMGLSVAQLGVIYGLWTVQPWGWTAGVALYALNVVLQLLNVVMGQASAILGVIISAGILAYIYSKRDVYKSSDRSVPRANEI